MIPIKHIDPEDLPLYAMHLLSPDEMEELTLHLQHSVQARRMLSEIYGDLSIFAQSAEMNEPPASARQRLMKNVAREKKDLPAHPLDQYAAAAPIPFATRDSSATFLDEEPAHKSIASRALPWIGWAIAAGIGIFSFNLAQENDQLKRSVTTERAEVLKTQTADEAANALLQAMKDPAAVHATLTTAEARPLPAGRISYSPDKGSLIFIASNLLPLQPYKTYELWVIPADGRDPVPAGTFKPDEHGYASVVMPELAKGVPAKAFGVTIEDAEGSATPTAPILLKGSPS